MSVSVETRNIFDDSLSWFKYLVFKLQECEKEMDEKHDLAYSLEKGDETDKLMHEVKLMYSEVQNNIKPQIKTALSEHFNESSLKIKITLSDDTPVIINDVDLSNLYYLNDVSLVGYNEGYLNGFNLMAVKDIELIS